MDVLLAVGDLHEPTRSEQPPSVEVLEEVKVGAGSLQLVQSSVDLPLALHLLQRLRREVGERVLGGVVIQAGSRVPVRAARSSSGSLLLRRRRAVHCIRRSRAVVGASPRAP